MYGEDDMTQELLRRKQLGICGSFQIYVSLSTKTPAHLSNESVCKRTSSL